MCNMNASQKARPPHLLVDVNTLCAHTNTDNIYTKLDISIKFRRYVDQSMRQMKTSQYDFFDDVCGKKFMKCPRVLSLLRAKGLNLGNKQSTILCVSRQQIFIILCEFSPDLREAAKPPLNNLFPNR